ncbi:hypothetical protein SpCBS45565_g00866 [Spizellomyces sp. 'palustris']|nr:hypothetical protein SpCBS45565_g00866 [Spizellomyces sp. 'palustris']
MSAISRVAVLSTRAISVSARKAAPAVCFSVASAARQATPTKESEPVIPGFREEGQIPTNWELIAGDERYEYLQRLAGKEPWEDLKPVVMSTRGTVANPTIIKGSDPERYIACTGYPADSHEAIWLTIRDHGRNDRCPHCGNVFKYQREHAHH